MGGGEGRDRRLVGTFSAGQDCPGNSAGAGTYLAAGFDRADDLRRSAPARNSLCRHCRIVLLARTAATGGGNSCREGVAHIFTTKATAKQRTVDAPFQRDASQSFGARCLALTAF